MFARVAVRAGRQQCVPGATAVRCAGQLAGGTPAQASALNSTACVGALPTLPSHEDHSARPDTHCSSPKDSHRVGGHATLQKGVWRQFGDVRRLSTAAVDGVRRADYAVIGGGPVGASTAWFLAENQSAVEVDSDAPEGTGTTVLVHDPTDRGAHEDWSRLARLSFDGPIDEFHLSQHALSLLDLVDEIRSYNPGAPVVPMKPGMVFVASPGTAMAEACARGESYGDGNFVRREVAELEELYPGNKFNLPPDTLCWSHPAGYCVSPIELADTARSTAEAYGAEVLRGRATVDVSPDDSTRVRVTVEKGADAGTVIDAKHAFLFAGAQSKEVLRLAVERHPDGNSVLAMPEFDHTYITGISTVRYRHANHPSEPAAGSGHVAQPITLGQLHIPDICDFQANFSVVAEEDGDVYKTRLSGDVGTEVIDTVAGLHAPAMMEKDEQMKELYQRVFGTLFPHLECETPLDFNRCVTYRNHNPVFSGTSILEKKLPGDDAGSLLTTVGCFGVGVKFGPALGQAAAAHVMGLDVEQGMHIFESGTDDVPPLEVSEIEERAW